MIKFQVRLSKVFFTKKEDSSAGPMHVLWMSKNSLNEIQAKYSHVLVKHRACKF